MIKSVITGFKYDREFGTASDRWWYVAIFVVNALAVALVIYGGSWSWLSTLNLIFAIWYGYLAMPTMLNTAVGDKEKDDTISNP